MPIKHDTAAPRSALWGAHHVVDGATEGDTIVLSGGDWVPTPLGSGQGGSSDFDENLHWAHVANVAAHTGAVGPEGPQGIPGEKGDKGDPGEVNDEYLWAHIAGSDPHPVYATDTDLSTHVGASDPHTGYRLESADHTHASTGLQGGQVAHSALSSITATDHHVAPASGPDANVTIDAAGAAGTASTFARSGHGHQVATTDAPSGANITLDAAPSAGTTGAIARATHGHRINTYASTPATVGTGAAGTSGTAPSRGDHAHPHEAAHVAHDTVWDAAGDLVVGSGADTASRLAITVPAANILNVLGVVNGETTATWKSVHDATAPAAIGTAAAGTSLTAPHRDHVHPTGAGTPSTQAFGDSATTGSGPAAAMTDHKHAMPANPVTGHEGASDPHPGYLLESAVIDFASLGHLMEHEGRASAHPPRAHDHSDPADGTTLDPEHIVLPLVSTDLGMLPAIAGGELKANYALFGEVDGLLVGQSDGGFISLTPNAVPAHEGASDPHPGYALDMDVPNAVNAHSALPDPHAGYVRESKLSTLVAGIVASIIPGVPPSLAQYAYENYQ